MATESPRTVGEWVALALGGALALAAFIFLFIVNGWVCDHAPHLLKTLIFWVGC